MRIKECNNITYVNKLLNKYKFNMSEHYCYNMNLIEKISEGSYKVINMLKGGEDYLSLLFLKMKFQ